MWHAETGAVPVSMSGSPPPQISTPSKQKRSTHVASRQNASPFCLDTYEVAAPELLLSRNSGDPTDLAQCMTQGLWSAWTC